MGKGWEDLRVGERVVVSRTVTDRDILLYAGLTGDLNPLYLQADFAEQTPYERLIVPPGLLVGWLTAIISNRLPGPGSTLREQRLGFPHPVGPGSTVTLSLEVIHKERTEKWITMRVTVRDGEGRTAVEGEIDVRPPGPVRTLLHEVCDNF